MATKLQVTELDFDDIKNNLKTFMKNQDEFSDYNFEGSGLSMLIDLLAYNTHYLAMNANMALNEAFLDSATQRSSVVSHAKTLGYTPRSARSPIAYVDVTLNNSARTSATISKGTKFTTKVDGSTYGFVVNESRTVTPTNGVLRFTNLPIYEGTLVTTKYTVDSNNLEKKYLVNDKRADTTTLKVSVQTSATDSTTEVFSLATDLSQVKADSRVYFLQEVDDGKFEVYFGDGIVGKKVNDGNIVILEYVVTNMTEANGARSFSGTSVAGETDISIATLVQASGGAEPESISSIKFNAPLDYASQGRAVTADDYKTIVPQVYADTKAVQVWGGEDNDPPIYGQVYISIKTKSGVNLTQAQKNTIGGYLGRYNIASVRPIIVDPEVIKIKLNVSFKFDATATSKSATELESDVRSVITTYNNEDLEKFDGIFRFSKLSRLVDATNSAILSNITTVKMTKEVTPTLNKEEQYIFKFANKLYNPHPGHNEENGGIVKTNGFKISGQENTVYFDDDGLGNIRLYYLVGGVTRTYINTTVGTINYATGDIIIPSLNIVSVVGGKITLETVPESNDLVPLRNQLLEIDDANTVITGELDTIVSGGSSAGTGYNTVSSHIG